jgi:hypothetical protein
MTTKDFPEYIAKIQKPKPVGWVWHAFHENLVSHLGYPLEARIDEVRQWKPAYQVNRRIRLMRPATIPQEVLDYIEGADHRMSFDKRNIDNYTNWDAPERLKNAIKQAHEEQCVQAQGVLGCPWNDEEGTIFPEVERRVVDEEQIYWEGPEIE